MMENGRAGRSLHRLWCGNTDAYGLLCGYSVFHVTAKCFFISEQQQPPPQSMLPWPPRHELGDGNGRAPDNQDSRTSRNELYLSTRVTSGGGGVGSGR